jgi:hypothetical protein
MLFIKSKLTYLIVTVALAISLLSAQEPQSPPKAEPGKVIVLEVQLAHFDPQSLFAGRCHTFTGHPPFPFEI